MSQDQHYYAAELRLEDEASQFVAFWHTEADATRDDMRALLGVIERSLEDLESAEHVNHFLTALFAANPIDQRKALKEIRDEMARGTPGWL